MPKVSNEKAMQVAYALELFDALPESLYANLSVTESRIELKLVVNTNADARRARQALKLRMWRKQFNKGCNWWEQHTESKGVHIKLYGIGEAPDTCKMISEEYTEIEQVPVKFEKQEIEVPVEFEPRTVVKTRMVPHCNPSKQSLEENRLQLTQ